MSGTYRYEIAKQGRAGCSNTACKKDAIKIDKGELRFGSLVTFKDHDSWKWKHWGCVTPAQIGNVIEQIGGTDGLDLDKDLDILDGYDELPSWAQDKIKFALTHGHVEDEDWKGEPELNRPGQKGINKRKKKKADDDEDEAGDAADTPKPKNKRASKKNEADEAEEQGDESPKPKKKTVGKKRKAAEADEADEEEQPKKKRPGRAAKNAKAAAGEEEVDSDELAVEATKPTNKRSKKQTESSGNPINGQTDGASENTKKAKASGKGKAKADAKEVANGPAKKSEKSQKPKAAAKVEVEEGDDVDAVEDAEPKKPTSKAKVSKNPQAEKEGKAAKDGSASTATKKRSKSKA